MIKIHLYRVLGTLGCNFFFLNTKPCRNHTNAYRGIKLAPGYLAHASPYSTIVDIRPTNENGDITHSNEMYESLIRPRALGYSFESNVRVSHMTRALGLILI